VSDGPFYAWLRSQPDEYHFVLHTFHNLRIPRNATKLCTLLKYLPLPAYKATREAMKDAHRKWRNRAEVMPMPAIQWDIETGTTVFNPEWLVRIHGTVDEVAPVTDEQWEALAKEKPSERVFLSPPHLSRETKDQLEWTHVADVINPQFEFISDRFEAYDIPDSGFPGMRGLRARKPVSMTIHFDLDEGVFDGFLRVFSDDHLKRAYGLEPPPVSNRWNRVYQRWGFKHRNKCCRCNATEGLVRVTLGQLLFCVDAEACDERAKLTNGNA
jgi:hypothetical protein